MTRWRISARLIRHHVGYAVSQRQLVNVYQREDRSLTGAWQRHFNHRRNQYVARWEAVIARCVPGAAAPEVAAVTQSILGLIFSIAYWPPQTAELPGLANLVVGFATRGLGSPAGRLRAQRGLRMTVFAGHRCGQLAGDTIRKDKRYGY